MTLRQTILLIEDDEAVRATMARQMAVDYNVLTARDGVDGIKLFERHNEQVVAIVTDLELPRISGDPVVDWVRRLTTQLPIIILTDKPVNIDLEILLRDPKTELLRKPFEPHELTSLLRELLNGSVLSESGPDEVAGLFETPQNARR